MNSSNNWNWNSHTWNNVKYGLTFLVQFATWISISIIAEDSIYHPWYTSLFQLLFRAQFKTQSIITSIVRYSNYYFKYCSTLDLLSSIYFANSTVISNAVQDSIYHLQHTLLFQLLFRAHLKTQSVISSVCQWLLQDEARSIISSIACYSNYYFIYCSTSDLLTPVPCTLLHMLFQVHSKEHLTQFMM